MAWKPISNCSCWPKVERNTGSIGHPQTATATATRRCSSACTEASSPGPELRRTTSAAAYTRQAVGREHRIGVGWGPRRGPYRGRGGRTPARGPTLAGGPDQRPCPLHRVGRPVPGDRAGIRAHPPRSAAAPPPADLALAGPWSPVLSRRPRCDPEAADSPLTTPIDLRAYRMLSDHPVFPILLSKDLDATRTFYRDVLGLEIARENVGDRIVFRCGGGTQLVVTHSTVGTKDTQTQLAWRVPDIRAAVAELRGLG